MFTSLHETHGYKNVAAAAVDESLPNQWLLPDLLEDLFKNDLIEKKIQLLMEPPQSVIMLSSNLNNKY